MATAKTDDTAEPEAKAAPEDIPDSSKTCGQFPADEVAATFNEPTAKPK